MKKCLSFIALSILYYLYTILLMWKNSNLFSEGGPGTTLTEYLIYLILLIPAFMVLIIYFIKNYKTFSYLRFIAYPLFISALMWGLALSFGVISLFLVVGIYPVCILIIIAVGIYGFIIDLKEYKVLFKNVNIKKNVLYLVPIIVFISLIPHIIHIVQSENIGKFKNINIAPSIHYYSSKPLSEKLLFIHNETDYENRIVSFSVFDVEKNKVINNGKFKNYSQIDTLLLRDGSLFIYGRNARQGDYHGVGYPTRALVCNTKTFKCKVSSPEPDPNYDTSLLELNNGNILITGGSINGEMIIEYDRKNNKFLKHKNLKVSRYSHTSIELNDNRILLLGGNQTRFELYNLNNDTSEVINSDKIVSYNSNEQSKAWLLNDGKVLFTVLNTNAIAANERQYLGILDLTSKNIELLKPYKFYPIWDYAIERISDDKFLITGGRNGNSSLGTKSTIIYDYKKNKFIPSRFKVKKKHCFHYMYRVGENTIFIDDNLFFFVKPEIIKLENVSK